jgi:hypothetical protein
MSFGVTVPWMMAALWVALTFIMLRNHDIKPEAISLVVPGMMSIMLLLLSLLCRTAYPQHMLDKHIAARFRGEGQSMPERSKGP